ncbi:MAG: ion channel [Bacteroidota bacterium]
METIPNRDDVNKDLGLGSRVSQGSHERFLNRDGSFNVRRGGLPFFRTLNMYHALLTMSWTKFYLLVSLAYFIANTVFASAYLLCGTEGFRGAEGITITQRFFEAFFFSVQTLATIGYGRISPNSFSVNVLVTLEALVGLLGFALATGLLFARFSRPNAKIIFSNNAVIAPYNEVTAFEFRIVNERSNELIEVTATVTLSRIETLNGQQVRKFYPLDLERNKVVFMPLHWVIVHPITQASPLFRITEQDFKKSDAEILILITGTDETFSQSVHTRSSYKSSEVVWGAKFGDVFVESGTGKLSIDMKKIHDIIKVG